MKKTFKGSKRQFLERRHKLLDIHRSIKTLMSTMKQRMTQKARILRNVRFVLLHNKKNVSFCVKNYEDIQGLLLEVWASFSEMNDMMSRLDLDELFKDILQDKALCVKVVKQKYKKAVKDLLKYSSSGDNVC